MDLADRWPGLARAADSKVGRISKTGRLVATSPRKQAIHSLLAIRSHPTTRTNRRHRQRTRICYGRIDRRRIGLFQPRGLHGTGAGHVWRCGPQHHPGPGTFGLNTAFARSFTLAERRRLNSASKPLTSESRELYELIHSSQCRQLWIAQFGGRHANDASSSEVKILKTSLPLLLTLLLLSAPGRLSNEAHVFD